MRVLLVSHDFLPLHPAGTEIYTWQLGRRLQRLGHEVHVFTTEKDISRPNLSLHRREWGGLAVHELTNNLFYTSFRETWDYPPAAEVFGRFLDELRPDVVHFMHLMYLSVGCVEESAARNLPVFFTLHDYWLQCPRFGQRVHADRSICHAIDFGRCGSCLSSFKFAQTRVERGLAKVVERVRGWTGVDLGPLARGARGRWARRRSQAIAASRAQRLHTAPPKLRTGQGAPAPASASFGPEAAALAHGVAERDAALRQRLVPIVDQFIAPSRFLRQSFIAWGLPEERVLSMRTGIDLEAFARIERKPSERLRVAFIGTVVEHKGVHVLLRAWRLLPAELRKRAELVVHGPLQHQPDYQSLVRALAESAGARLLGPLDRGDVPQALAETDLLVVPSVWYENSPLIILEALATRTPLLVSNLGGMAELVEDGVTGYHFRVGSEEDLARQLQFLLANPEGLASLYPEGRTVRDVGEDAQDLAHLYTLAIERRTRPTP
ncbi:MAG: glycosyltransferase [Planctomycetaceae bacterium]|nr:glycosyltransferase [Planctomycetaceae bacterium]